jgi:hypothetical protein
VPKRTPITLILCSVLFCAAVLRAQGSATGSPLSNTAAEATVRQLTAGMPNSPCAIALKRAWEQELEFEDTYLSNSPATDARKLFAKEDALDESLFSCQPTAQDKSDPALMAALTMERLNLQFISSVEVSYGGLKLSGDSTFHEDLGHVAPACQEVLASRLPERIEAFESKHSDPSTVKAEDLWPLYNEAEPRKNAGLSICALQADQAGYKDVALRLDSDEAVLDSLVLVTSLNNDAKLLRADRQLFERLEDAPSHTVPVELGPQHCTATLHDWGWEKTVDWDCY